MVCIDTQVFLRARDCLITCAKQWVAMSYHSPSGWIRRYFPWQEIMFDHLCITRRNHGIYADNRVWCARLRCRFVADSAHIAVRLRVRAESAIFPSLHHTCSSSYRPIALASSLSKTLEHLNLIKYSTFLHTSPLQFGFKPGSSTTLCTGVVKNIISRYIHSGSSVHGCFLDASKALF